VLRIGLLVFPNFNVLDLSGPLAAFDVPRREIRPSPYSLIALSEAGGEVMSSCGISVNTTALDGDVFDTFIVVGGLGAIEASRSPSIIERVRRAASTARRTASVCSGAFVLAEAGLLAGRRVTTHWEYATTFRRAFPNVKLESDQIYLRDGNIWSSGGVTAGIDLALAMIEQDVGLAMAQRTARVLVVYHRRTGGQSQYSALLEMEPSGDRLRKALQFAREHIAEPLPVERLAMAAHLSPRQFTRLFLRETGETPAKAVERLRAEVAHMQVSTGTASLESIARSVGFVNAERMRRAFIRLYGQPPQAVRRTAAMHEEAVQA
jgi:transcriptional regulator GlxA family with amidase domain